MFKNMYTDLSPLELQAVLTLFESENELLAEDELPANAKDLLVEFIMLDESAKTMLFDEIESQQNLYQALADTYGDDADIVIDNILSATPADMDPLLSLIPDENAADIASSFPEWSFGTLYPIGFRVQYLNGLYSCVQLHASQQGWEPPNVHALWRRISEPDTIPAWVQPTGAQDAYNIGDKVAHNDKIWESIVDANVWEPGSVGTDNLWKEVEADEGE